MRKGFTLIELLVVVLIIGILAAIALPQYTRAVEKAKTAEVLANIKTMEDAMDIWLLENGGYPSSHVDFKDMGTAMGLSGGEWDGDSYYTKDFEYLGFCGPENCHTEPYRNSGDYTFWTIRGKDGSVTYDNWHHVCITRLTDMGRYICKSLEGLGWEYVDAEI